MSDDTAPVTHVHQAGKQQATAAYVIDRWVKTFLLIGALLLLWLFAWLFDWNIPLPEIRPEDWVAAFAPALLIPWLWFFAWAGGRLLLVLEGPTQLAAYHVNKRAKLKLTGNPVRMSSTSGTEWLVLTEFDPKTHEGSMSQYEGKTQLDVLRDHAVIERFSLELAGLTRDAMHNRFLLAHLVQKGISKHSKEHVDLAMGLMSGPMDLLKEAGFTTDELAGDFSIKHEDPERIEIGGDDDED